MNIYGSKVILRSMEPEDMDMLQEMINDPDIEGMVGGWSYPVSRYEQMKWYESVVCDKQNLRFIIEEKNTREALGMMGLMEIDWKNRTAESAIKLKKDAPKRQGYATDAEFTLMQFAFESMQLHRLSAEILEYNTASIALHEKCGARREGLKREAVFKKGKYHNVVCYGVFYEDFLKAAEKAGWSR